MALETGTYISDLVATNPAAGDSPSQGDDHLRLLKALLLATFPGITGAVTPTHTELNYVDGVTSSIQTQLTIFTNRTFSANVTLALTDAGYLLVHPSADTTARTVAIPANGTVAFPIGTTLTIANQASAGVVTVSITTDTLRLAGAGSTGPRSLAANGLATLVKITATEWMISGSGLT